MIRLLSGDCRDVLATLPAESVQCVVTSPPYYGLRDYGTALWAGGDAMCEHAQGKSRNDGSNGRHNSAVFHGSMSTEHGGGTAQFRDTCGKCGAVRVDRQIGLEQSPEAYLATMVAVFREVRRVLRRDGTCWVNMGDSYAASTKGSGGVSHSSSFHATAETGRSAAGVVLAQRFEPRKFGMGDAKPKDLLLMPARLALALQADGWWVRSDIIWHKPNPMPESVTDRCVSAHEHVFMLTKAQRYYFDSDAIRENATADNREVFRGAGSYVNGNSHSNAAVMAASGKGHVEGVGTRSCRNVWTIATSPFSAAHFATFPPELAERCIKAGTSERGCCAACGKPWVRVRERGVAPVMRSENDGRGYVFPKAILARPNAGNGWMPNAHYETTTTGWSPGCQCHGHFEERPAAPDWISDETGERKTVRVWVPDGDAPPPVPCTVLDPFAGAGTTLLVADRQQRDAVGVELNTAYTEMAMERCRADAPLFTSFPPAEPPEDERMVDLFADDEYERPKSLTTPRHDGNRWNENNGRGFKPRQEPDMAAD